MQGLRSSSAAGRAADEGGPRGVGAEKVAPKDRVYPLPPDRNYRCAVTTGFLLAIRGLSDRRKPFPLHCPPNPADRRLSCRCDGLGESLTISARGLPAVGDPNIGNPLY